MSGQVDIVAVTYRDRLARFDLEHLFDKHDVRVEVVLGDGSEDRQELVENLLEVVSSFAGKLYGTGRRRRSSLTASGGYWRIEKGGLRCQDSCH
jgi:Predicted site-specific integrase-resolvase